MNVRVEAAQILDQVITKGKSLSELIPKHHAQKPMLQEICFGSCRYYFLLKDILNQLLTKPLKDKKIEALLITALYQLKFMNSAEYAVINDSVNAALALKQPRAKGLVNAILRNFLRRKPEATHSTHPDWLKHAIEKNWADGAEKVLKSNDERPPMTLRINSQNISKADYLELLTKNNIKVTEHPHAGIILEKPCDVFDLPKFKEGFVSVQDASAQLAATLLPIKECDTVLDACAAPGGKTAHLLELHPSIKLTALDIDETRNKRITENLMRLNLNANVITQDALEFKSNELFDCILLDAPCSATGVIRRHPDIKLLRRESDIKKLSVLQLDLLKYLWASLKPEGHMLYCTCSIFPEENERVIEAFLKESNADIIPIEADWGLKQKHGRQVLPGQDNMDGFYYCLLQKCPK